MGLTHTKKLAKKVQEIKNEEDKPSMLQSNELTGRKALPKYLTIPQVTKQIAERKNRKKNKNA